MAPRETAAERHASLLKQRALQALTRLGDRDTMRVAVKELTRLIATMPPEHIPVILQCLCDESAAAPKAVARRVRSRRGRLAHRAPSRPPPPPTRLVRSDVNNRPSSRTPTTSPSARAGPRRASRTPP